MFLRFKFFILSAFVLTILGCGGDEEEILLDEEIVAEEWINPVDIGKEYMIENVEVGDEVLLSTGGRRTVGDFDVIDSLGGGVFYLIAIEPAPTPEKPDLFEIVDEGFVVPEGPPIVSLYSRDILLEKGIGHLSRLIEFPIQKHNNVLRRDRELVRFLSYSVGIDRVLDYHLLVYVEYQMLDSPELGSAVYRGRQLILIPKGETLVFGGGVPIDDNYRYFDKISIRVLPYTNMEDIQLPVEVDNLSSSSVAGLPKKDVTVVKGHEFRPYRIASSSFYMREAIPPESNW